MSGLYLQIKKYFKVLLKLQFACLFLIISNVKAADSNDQHCNFEGAIKYFHNKKNKLAIEQFLLCLNQPALRVSSHFYLGISYRNLDKFEQALAYLHPILGEDKNNVNYYIEYAYTFEKSGNHQKALNSYKNTLIEHPDNLVARLGVARLYHWTGKINQSIEEYRELMTIDPINFDVKLGLAYALMADRKLTESKSLFKMVLTDDPNNGSAKNGISMLNKMNNYQLNLISDHIRFGEKSTKSEKVMLIATPDFSFKWGVGVLKYQHPIDSFIIDAVSTNRLILNEYSLFGAYKNTVKNEVLVEYSVQDLFESNYLKKIKFENYYKYNQNNLFSFGITQSYIRSKKTNTLTTIGLMHKTKNQLEFSGQLFYSSDKEFFDSQSFSASVSKTTQNDTRFQLGASVNRLNGNISVTSFGHISFRLKNNIKLTTNIARNTENQFSQYNVGFHYEF